MLLHVHLDSPPLAADGPAFAWWLWKTRRQFAAGARLANLVAGVSPDVCKSLQDRWHVPSKKLVLLTNATPLPASTTTIRRDPHPTTIVSVGALRGQKRMDLVVRCAAELRAHGADFRWHIVGDGPLRADLNKQIHDAGLDTSVTLEGPQDDVSSWLLRADLFALFSAQEGLCLAVLEALAHGLPAVLTVGAAASLPHDAVLIAADEPQALAFAVHSLLSDLEERRRLAKAGRSLVEDHFTVPRYYDALGSVYARACGSRDRRDSES